MTDEIKLKTRDWERLLTPAQQSKYKNAIRMGYFSNYHGREWKHDTFYGAYIWKYPNRVKVVERFTDMLGHKPEWEDVTDDNLSDLVEVLNDNYSPNSVKVICAEIKSVLRANGETKDFESIGYSKILKAKSVPAQAVFLTDEEVKRVVDYCPETPLERFVQRMFVIECLTGARAGDCLRISKDNIDESGRMIAYVAQKHKKEIHVPIHRWLRPFLVDGTCNTRYANGTTTSSFNRCLRDICKKCHINTHVKIYSAGKYQSGEKWEFVSSHTGRRSFATNLALKGIPIEQISLLMGHTNGNVANTAMTQRYIVGKMSIDSNVMKVFGAYDDLPATEEEMEEFDKKNEISNQIN